MATAATGPHGAAPGAIAATAHPMAHQRGADTFVRAQRHSRRVRALKFLLPGLAVAGIAGFLGWSYLAVPGVETIEGVDARDTAIKDGKLVMANPKLDGFTRENLPYSMTAVRAIQDMKQTGVIALEQIDANLPVTAKNTAKVIAKTGVYDNAKNTLVIDSPVKVTTTDGMVANLMSANVDIGGGSMSTADPVEITLDRSRITADSMAISENGKVFVFEKRVRVDIEPKNKAGDAAEKGKTDAGK